jgi:glycerophosphoryl diester phosphodiesterase
MSYTNLPRVIGHRTGGDPENTVQGLNAALPYTSMVEIDIRFTEDNKIVLAHDDTLNRMTNCTGTVESRTLAQLGHCLIDSIEEPLPTLDDFLDEVPDNVVVMIEPKDQTESVNSMELSSYEMSKMWATIKNHNMEKRVIIESFSITNLKRMKASAPAGVRFALVDSGSLATPTTAKSVASFYVVKWTLVSRSRVAAYRDKGLYVILYTPNSRADLLAASRFGANGILTDEVKRLHDLKQELS